MECFRECSYKYKLRYLDGIKSVDVRSALFFGNAFDSALDVILLTKKKKLTEKEEQLLQRTPYDVFDETFRYVKHNGDELDLAYSEQAIFSKADYHECSTTKNVEGKTVQKCGEEYCSSLLTDGDYKQIEEGINPKWLIMRRKGHLMLDAYKEEIMPRIEEVYSVQGWVKLKNGDGDEFIGKKDAEIKIVGVEGRVILDNKSAKDQSAKFRYTTEDVNKRPQLPTYSEAAGVDKGAYAVVYKKLYKKAPFIRTDFVYDDIKEETKDLLFEEIDDMLHEMREERYEKHTDTSKCFKYGKCEYYNLCHRNNSKGLVKIERKK